MFFSFSLKSFASDPRRKWQSHLMDISSTIFLWGTKFCMAAQNSAVSESFLRLSLYTSSVKLNPELSSFSGSENGFLETTRSVRLIHSLVWSSIPLYVYYIRPHFWAESSEVLYVPSVGHDRMDANTTNTCKCNWWCCKTVLWNYPEWCAVQGRTSTKS